MKKVYVFAFITIILAVFACTIPTAVEISGSPNLWFSSNMDLGEMLSQMVTGGFDNDSEGPEILPCSNTNTQTYIIHMELFNGELDLSDAIGSTPNTDITLPYDIILIDNNEPAILPFANLNDYIDDFDFKTNSVKSKLYVSGSGIAEILSIRLRAGDYHEKTINITENMASGREGWGNEYTGTSEPTGGDDIDVFSDWLNNKEDLDITFAIFIEGGKTIETQWFLDAAIKVELVIWLPLEFTAGAAGAQLFLPDGFFGSEGYDFFGRGAPGNDNSITQILQYLNFVIEMNENPFLGAHLIITSTGGLVITERLTGNSLNLSVDAENMERLNNPDYFPYSPKISIRFDPYDSITGTGGQLILPRDFKATAVYFETKFNFTYGDTEK